MESVIRTLDFPFGCHHGDLSRVFTLAGGSYRVCCSCGAKFAYSLEQMRTGRRVPRRPMPRWLRIG